MTRRKLFYGVNREERFTRRELMVVLRFFEEELRHLDRKAKMDKKYKLQEPEFRSRRRSIYRTTIRELELTIRIAAKEDTSWVNERSSTG